MAGRDDLRDASDVQRFLTFRAAGRLYAAPSEKVREIVLPSSMARVPLSPKPLLGLANLRGVVLPVCSLRLLLGLKEEHSGAGQQRVIVLEGRPAFGILVDDVAALTPVSSADITDTSAHLSADAGEIVLGGFPVEGAEGLARILDIDALLTRGLGAGARRSSAPAPALVRPGKTAAAAIRRLETFITFEVAGQEFGLPLESVREVLPSAAVTAPLPRAETAVLGLTALRSALLPLLSMRVLLGFSGEGGRQMTIVVSVSGVSVGLAVDAVRDIVRIEASELEPVPAAISSRSQGEARVQSVLKIDGGQRLIAILSPDKLFREDVMTRIKASAAAAAPSAARSTANGAERVFLVFTLAGQEFGLAISAVEEVARVPEDVTRLPKAPDFLKGVVNLRGTVLPIIDQRQRFDLPASEAPVAGRLVVVRIDATVAGFIVDGVSEVLRIAAGSIDPPPDAIVHARVLEGVINLEGSGRMVLLLDPTQLLSRTEQGLLDALSRVQEAQAAVDQGPDR